MVKVVKSIYMFPRFKNKIHKTPTYVFCHSTVIELLCEIIVKFPTPTRDGSMINSSQTSTILWTTLSGADLDRDISP